MTGLKLWSNRTNQHRPDPQPAAKTPASLPELVPVRPKRQVHFGRHLAFSIGDNSVQMAAASHFGTRLILHQVSKTYFPVPNEPDADNQMQVMAAIREFVEEFGGRQPTISVTVAGPETALRIVLMPHLRSSELKSAVRYELKRQIPFPAGDCRFDYRIYRRSADKRDRRAKVAILAATKRLVKKKLAPFSELGLEVAYVYHAQDVVGQLLRRLPYFDENSGYALINIRQERSEISYYLGSNLEFIHISSLGSTFLANRSDPTMFEYFAESLATEIQNSLDFYGGQYAERLTSQVFVYGDLSYTDELMKLLKNRFGFAFGRFPAEQLDFIKGKELAFEHSLPVCLTTLAAATNCARLPNLLPESRKARRARRLIDRLGISALAVVAGLSLGYWLTVRSSAGSARDSLNILNQQIEEFRATEMYATYSQLKRKIATGEQYISKTRDVLSYLGLNLKELSQITPETVQLYYLDYRAASPEVNYQLAGVISTRVTPPELVLAEYVENLTASPFFENVTIARHVKKRLANGFELDFDLNLKGII